MPALPVRLTLDRDLPVPLVTQLSGLVRYGIACGEFRAGDRLPSVRELAEDVGVAPMTIAAVYRDLKAAGLIEARAGSGTFVARRTGALDRRMQQLYRRVDALIDEGLAMRLDGGDLAGLLAARLSARQMRGRALSVVLVGLFAGATADYARAVGTALGRNVNVEPATIDGLQCVDEIRRRVAAADLVLTFAHLRRDVAAQLPGQRVAAISFIPSETTRHALAGLDPTASVLAVSRFPEFLPSMRAGVMRFAPQVGAVEAAVLEADDLGARLDGRDVVVYATGAEAVVGRLPTGTRAIEYRHCPDPGDIERVVRPLLAGLEPQAEARKEAS